MSKVGTSSMTPVVLFSLFRVYSKAPPSRVQFSLPKKFCFTACARLSLWEFAYLFSHKAVKMSLIWFSNYDSDRADSLRNSLLFDPTAQVGFSCRSRRDDEVVSRQSSKWHSVFHILSQSFIEISTSMNCPLPLSRIFFLGPLGL